MENNKNLAKFDDLILKGEATWWQMELPSGNVLFGESKAKMLGFSDDRFKTYHDFTSLIHPEDYEKTMKAMRDHLDGKMSAYETMYRIKNKNGEYINFFDYGQKIKQDDNKITIIGFVVKINDIKNPENEIKSFKELITGGNISIIELFNKTQKTI